MEKLLFNASILQEIFNDSSAICELKAFLNTLIDEQLESGDDMDCDFIDTCVEALEELELQEPNVSPHLMSVLCEERFIKEIKNKSALGSLKYKKLAVICACAMLLVSVSNVKTKSGDSVAKSISNKIANVLHINKIDVPNEKTTQAEQTTLTLPEAQTVTEVVTKEQNTVTVEKTTEREATTLVTNCTTDVNELPDEGASIAIIPVTPSVTQANTVSTTLPSPSSVPENEGIILPTVAETTKVEQTEETPSKPGKAPSNELIIPQAVLESIYGIYSSELKTVYKLGEALDLKGLQVMAVYNNGTQKEIPVSECSVNVSRRFSKDPGNYRVTVAYEGKTFYFSVTVYAEKDSVILNSIYGIFPADFDFKVDSFDNIDLSEMRVIAVYSDSSEELISPDNYDINIERNYLGLKNKALVTVTYEGRSFSFILTKEAKGNE